MHRPAVIKRLVTDFAARRPIRTTSLIVTVFGDVVSQHGGVIWLGSLVDCLGTLGIGDRLVRTSVFRLVQEGWLEFDRVGRRSYYRFTDYGAHEYERAARRVYAVDQAPWKGNWQLLIPLAVPDQDRERLRRSLHWQGFRNIAAGTFARPGDVDRTLRETLDEFDAADRVLLMAADTIPSATSKLVRNMVQENWHLDEVAQEFTAFVSRYKPLQRYLRRIAAVDPQTAFIARTMLIHDYRRLLLRATVLPEELLPSAWPGGEARRLTSRLYLALAEPSIAYITTQLEAGNGTMPAPKTSFSARFRARA